MDFHVQRYMSMPPLAEGCPVGWNSFHPADRFEDPLIRNGHSAVDGVIDPTDPEYPWLRWDFENQMRPVENPPMDVPWRPTIGHDEDML